MMRTISDNAAETFCEYQAEWAQVLFVNALTKWNRDADIDSDGAVHVDNGLVDVAVFPIGIQPEEFDKLFNDSEVQATMSALKQQLGSMEVIVGLERMDYIKGIPEKLRAFDKFLTSYPERKGKVKLIQVAVPSRDGCAEYQKLISEVNSLVSEINGKHSMFLLAPRNVFERMP